jgi:hypothetical protein
MEFQDIAKTAGLSATIVGAIGAIIAIIKKLNNKKFHSSCCGKDMDIVVAVNELTEEDKKQLTPHPSPAIAPIKPKEELKDNIAL